MSKKTHPDTVAAHEAETGVCTALCMIRLIETVIQGNEGTDLILDSQDDKSGRSLRLGMVHLTAFVESELNKALEYIYQNTGKRKIAPPPSSTGRN